MFWPLALAAASIALVSDAVKRTWTTRPIASPFGSFGLPTFLAFFCCSKVLDLLYDGCSYLNLIHFKEHLAKHPQSKRHKKNAEKHQQQAARKEMVSEMSATPNRQPSTNPRRNRRDREYSPTPSQVMRCFIGWLRGFHWNREKAKVTDWLVVILTLGVAVAAIWSVWVFQGQLDEARKSTRLSVRPWIGLDEGQSAIETTPLQIDKDGNAALVYKIVAKNYGSTPAANVWAMANLVVADDLNTVYEQQDRACSDDLIGKPDIGMVLFQGKDRVFSAMPSTTQISKKHEGSRLQAFLAGCIGYRDQFSYLCRTKFLWMLQDNTGQVIVFDAPNQSLVINGHFVPGSTGGAIDSCQIAKYNYGEGVYAYAKKPN